jgi:serine/threonine protein kinase
VQQIGRYQIAGELGRGAMGIVYRAQDPAIGRTIAIKSIRLEDLTDEAERGRLRERLFREAQSAGILSHPGIVTIYDIAEQDGMAYIFMEFVNGPPLEKMLAAEQAPDGETLLSILRQVAAALDYAHKKGIIHRDIKPANIMVHEDGAAKVTDFGVAKIVSQQMTQAGTMMGTPSYMSPEQVQGTAITGRADQFALAVIAYEVLTGEKPFSAEYLPTLLFKIVREDPVPPQRLNATLTPSIEQAVARALSKNPEDRYETCTEFVTALSAACAASPGWRPLPRGASQNMPTAGSLDRLRAQVSPDAETLASAADVTVAEQARPTPAMSEPHASARPGLPVEVSVAPAIRDPLSRPVPAQGHLVRNVMLVAAVLVALGVAAVIGLKNRGTEEAKTTEATAAPAVTPSSPEAPAVTPGASKAEETAPAPAIPEPPTPAQNKEVPRPPVAARNDIKLPGAGPFQLTTNPPGAKAIFDADSSTECTSPCKLELPSGRHAFVVTHAGYHDAQRVIEIPRDTGLIVDLSPMAGTLSIATTPAGLAVVIDGKEQARRTPMSVTLPVGEHRVQVLRGSDRQEFTVQIQDGAISSRTIEWQ